MQRKYANGSITVFLSLILTLVLAVMLAALESARAAGRGYRLRIAADSALQSVFAEYDRQLWDDYRLLLCNTGSGREEDVQARMLTYADYYSDASSDMGGYDIFSMKMNSVQVTDAVFATDQDGAIFEREILDYMETGGASIAIDKIKEKLGVLDDEDAKQAASSDDSKEFDFNDEWDNYNSMKKEYLETEADAEGQPQDESTAGTQAQLSAPAATGDSEYEGNTYEKNIITVLYDLLTKGVLSIVLDSTDNISAETFLTDDRPSAAIHETGQVSGDDVVVGQSSVTDMIMINEYLMNFMRCYTPEYGTPTSGVPDFELEYVIAGKDSDLSNLKSIITRLLWLREAMNFAYIVTDSEKKSEAQLVAMAIIGWTGIEPFIQGVKYLVLAAWAYGESLCDVRQLLGGHKSEFVKTRDSWQMSLSALISMQFPDGSGNDSEKGMSYGDYLRLFLYLTDRSARDYRAMDVIQMRQRLTSPDFTLKNCLYSCSATLDAYGEGIFAVIPESVGGIWQESRKTKYSY